MEHSQSRSYVLYICIQITVKFDAPPSVHTFNLFLQMLAICWKLTPVGAWILCRHCFASFVLKIFRFEKLLMNSHGKVCFSAKLFLLLKTIRGSLTLPKNINTCESYKSNWRFYRIFNTLRTLHYMLA